MLTLCFRFGRIIRQKFSSPWCTFFPASCALQSALCLHIISTTFRTAKRVSNLRIMISTGEKQSQDTRCVSIHSQLVCRLITYGQEFVNSYDLGYATPVYSSNPGWCRVFQEEEKLTILFQHWARRIVRKTLIISPSLLTDFSPLYTLFIPLRINPYTDGTAWARRTGYDKHHGLRQGEELTDDEDDDVWTRCAALLISNPVRWA